MLHFPRQLKFLSGMQRSFYLGTVLIGGLFYFNNLLLEELNQASDFLSLICAYNSTFVCVVFWSETVAD